MSVLDGDSPLETPLGMFIVQLILIVGLSRLLRYVCQRVRQPMVVAEMIAGILLGPSVLGRIPGFSETIFPPDSHVILDVMANVGLIFFMFLVGMELKTDILQDKLKSSVIISTIGVIVPFAVSIPVSFFLYTSEYAMDSSFVEFILFMGIAMGVSALPVLARILAERKMLQDQLGVVALAATAIDDLEAWFMLAIVVSLARAADKLNILYTALLFVGNIIILYFIKKYIMKNLSARIQTNNNVTQTSFFFVFLLLFSFAWLTDLIGLTVILGAFEIGCVVPRGTKMISELSEKLEDLVVVVFVPLFFTYSGLQTDFGHLNTGEAWGFFFLIFFVAFLSKVSSCAAAAIWVGNHQFIDSVCFGILMQTKGLVALVIFNVGLQYHVISSKLFAINVLMGLVSTILTTPLLELIMARKGNIIKGTSGVFSILVHPPSLEASNNLMSVAECLVQGYKDNDYKIIALALLTGLDKPSKFMNPQLTGTAQNRDSMLFSLRQRENNTGVKIETVANMKVAHGKDICDVAHDNGVHLVLLGSNNFHFGRSVRHVIDHAETDVGILIGNSKQLEDKLHKVLVIIAYWYFQPTVDTLIHYAAKMSKNREKRGRSNTPHTPPSPIPSPPLPPSPIPSPPLPPSPTLAFDDRETKEHLGHREMEDITPDPISPSSLNNNNNNNNAPTAPITSTSRASTGTSVTIIRMINNHIHGDDRESDRISDNCGDSSIQFVKKETVKEVMELITEGDYSLVVISYDEHFSKKEDIQMSSRYTREEFNSAIQKINPSFPPLLIIHAKSEHENERRTRSNGKYDSLPHTVIMEN